MGIEQIQAWAASTAYSLGDFCYFTTGNYWYECTSTGTSGGSEPTAAVSAGQTVNDNTVEWTSYAIDLNVLTDNESDIAEATKRIKDLYIAGDLNDGSNSISVAEIVALSGIQGAQGYQGWQGTAGSIGVDGVQGAQGFQGYQGYGVQGFQGTNPGPQGNQGWQGTQGFQGVGLGAQGYQGFQGTNPGPQGDSGAQGAQGYQGSAGSSGAQGIQGPQGWQGTAGSNGVQGAQGYQGSAGSSGAQGAQGIDGSQGYQGSGSNGVQGAQGYQGAGGGNQGPQGAQGYQGDSGSSGSQGVQGWQGTAGSSGSQGIAGSNGVQGAQGYQGSGSSGSQGYQGSAGSNGVQGAQGWQGPSEAGAQGYQGIGGAQGYQGAGGGNQGSQGAQGWQGPSEAGVQGYQGISGSSGAQGFQGQSEAGAQGYQGITGSQGFQGQSEAGVQGYQGTAGSQGYQGAGGGNQGPQGYQGAGGGNQGPQGFQGQSEAGAQGYQGFQGAGGGNQGPQGYQGTAGSNGVQGAQGYQGWQGELPFTNAPGDGSMIQLDEYGTQGPQGVLGPQSGDIWIQAKNATTKELRYYDGSDQFKVPLSTGDIVGTQGHQGAQGYQGAQGSQGYQGNLGPQGYQGNDASGAQGYQGAQGFQGSQGPQGWQGSSGESWTTVNSVTTDQSPATSDEGELFIFTSATAGSKTFTLPSVGAGDDGITFYVQNDGEYEVFIRPSDSDSVWTNGDGYGIDLVEKSIVGLKYNHSDTNWKVISKTGGLVKLEGLVLHILPRSIGLKATGSTTNGIVVDEVRRHLVESVNDAAMSSIDGWRNYALELDGTDDYCSVADSSDWDVFGSTDTDVTISFTVILDNATGSTGGDAFIGQREDANNRWFVVRAESSNTITLKYVRAGSTDIDISGGNVTTTQSTITIVKKGAETGVYVDDTQVAYDATFTADTFAGSLYIGETGAGVSYCDGQIQDLFIIYSNVFNASPNSTPDDTISITQKPFVGVM